MCRDLIGLVLEPTSPRPTKESFKRHLPPPTTKPHTLLNPGSLSFFPCLSLPLIFSGGTAPPPPYSHTFTTPTLTPQLFASNPPHPHKHSTPKPTPIFCPCPHLHLQLQRTEHEHQHPRQEARGEIARGEAAWEAARGEEEKHPTQGAPLCCTDYPSGLSRGLWRWTLPPLEGVQL